MTKKYLLIAALCALNVNATPWLIEDQTPMVVVCDGAEISYFQVDATAQATLSVTLSPEEFRWLKANMGKKDFKKLLAKVECDLGEELRNMFKQKQPAVLSVQTPAGRFAVQLIVEKDAQPQFAVYGASEDRPDWLFVTISAVYELSKPSPKGVPALVKALGAGALIGGGYFAWGRSTSPANMPRGNGGRRPEDRAQEDHYRREASRLIDGVLGAYRLPGQDVGDNRIARIATGAENLTTLPQTLVEEEASVPPFTRIVGSIYLGGCGFTERLIRERNSSTAGLEYMDQNYETVFFAGDPQTFSTVVMAAAERIDGFDNCQYRHEPNINGLGVEYYFVPMHENCCPFKSTCPFDLSREQGQRYGSKLSRDGSQFEFKNYDLFHNDFFGHSEIVFAALDKALATGQPLLVHCSAGSHRSASIVLAWMASRAHERHSCWKIACYLKSLRGNVKDIREALERGCESAFATAAKHYAALRTGAQCPGCPVHVVA